MKKIGEKSRRILRRIYLFLGASAISMTFMACYGTLPANYNQENYNHDYSSGTDNEVAVNADEDSGES